MRGEDLFNARVFQSAETTTTFYQFIATLRQKITDEVKDTSATHKFIRTLRDGGRLMRCYTQNIDGLEAREGLCLDLIRGRGNKRRFLKKNYELPRPKCTSGTDFESGCEVVQLHGELTNLRCRLCATEQEWTQEETEIFLEGAAPKCERCNEKSQLRQATGKRGLAVGELRPNIVLYGEDHPQNALLVPLIAFDQSSSPDVLVIMGTSLKVHGLQKVVRDFAKVVHAQKNGRVVFVNRTRPSESQWEGIIDDYIAMDCDDWIADLRNRREDLWLRQGELQLRPTKLAGQKRKRDSIDDVELASAQPMKRANVSVDVPVIRRKRSVNSKKSIVVHQDQSGATTPVARKATGWKNRDSATLNASVVLSPIVQRRPGYSPLTKHFGPRHGDEIPAPGSPRSPAVSVLNERTPLATRLIQTTSEPVTPTPKQLLRAKQTGSATVFRKSRLASSTEVENHAPTNATPMLQAALEPLVVEEDAEEMIVLNEEHGPSSTIQKLSFLGEADGLEHPLVAKSKGSFLRELHDFVSSRP